MPGPCLNQRPTIYQRSALAGGEARIDLTIGQKQAGRFRGMIKGEPRRLSSQRFGVFERSSGENKGEATCHTNFPGLGLISPSYAPRRAGPIASFSGEFPSDVPSPSALLQANPLLM